MERDGFTRKTVGKHTMTLMGAEEKELNSGRKIFYVTFPTDKNVIA